MPILSKRGASSRSIRCASGSTHFLRWSFWVALPVRTAFAITTDLFAPIAQANDALEAKVRAYVAVFSLAKPAWKVGSYPGKNEVKIT
jgi:hypothetical protein